MGDGGGERRGGGRLQLLQLVAAAAALSHAVDDRLLQYDRTVHPSFFLSRRQTAPGSAYIYGEFHYPRTIQKMENENMDVIFFNFALTT